MKQIKPNFIGAIGFAYDCPNCKQHKRVITEHKPILPKHFPYKHTCSCNQELEVVLDELK